jgi:hypothetical protein
LRNLPFPFAHELLITPGRAAVIDHPTAVANLRRTVLPEIIAHTRASSPMIAQQNGSGQMLGPRQ